MVYSQKTSVKEQAMTKAASRRRTVASSSAAVVELRDIQQLWRQRITAWRQERRMSQVELGKKINWSGRSMSLWEKGGQDIDVNRAFAAARVLGHTDNELITGVQEQDPRFQALSNAYFRLDEIRQASLVTLIVGVADEMASFSGGRQGAQTPPASSRRSRRA